MKPYRRIAAWMTNLVLALALTPVAQATPTTLNFDFAGLVGSTGAPGLDGWPGGQTISGRWSMSFDDDPSLDSPVHLPGDRWSSVPGGLSYTLQSVGAVPGSVAVLTVSVPSLKSGRKARPAKLNATRDATKASTLTSVTPFQRVSVASSTRR